jgi:phosphatidate cytidylyltransferase
VVGLLLVGVIFCFINTIFFNLALVAFSIMAAFELNRAVIKEKSQVLLVVSCLPAVLTPFANELGNKLLLAIFVTVVSLFLVLLFNRKEVTIQEGLAVFGFSFLNAVSFSSLAFLRDVLPKESRVAGLVVVCASAWLTDTFAFLIGIVAGRHKLIADVSPKKTWEGLVGGVVLSVGVSTIVYIMFKRADKLSEVSLPILVLLFIGAAVLAVVGDLVASLVKRQNNVKDFGNIMPGHGGVLDRLDSLFFVAPYFYLVERMVN